MVKRPSRVNQAREARNPFKTATGEPASEEGRPAHEYRKVGFARIGQHPLLGVEDIHRAISAHISGKLRLDKEQMDSLKLLGQYLGMWGTGRKPPKSNEDAGHAREFTMGTAKAQE